MTVMEFLTLMMQISGLLFIVTSMLGMGLSWSIAQILQPLKNIRLVILALAANFILVPLLAYGITRLIPMDASLSTGLLILATAAGSPFLPKLTQGAKGNLAFSVAMITLLMVITIIYMPLVLPLLLPGIAVNPLDIAKSMILLMLVPLVLGFLYKSLSPESADRWKPFVDKICNLALLMLLVLGLGLKFPKILDLIGSRGLLALVIFIVGSLLIGLLLGGRNREDRSVVGFGTAQRNIAASLLVGVQNFPGTITLPFILVAEVIMLLILLPTSKWLGSRKKELPGDSGES